MHNLRKIRVEIPLPLCSPIKVGSLFSRGVKKRGSFRQLAANCESFFGISLTGLPIHTAINSFLSTSRFLFAEIPALHDLTFSCCSLFLNFAGKGSEKTGIACLTTIRDVRAQFSSGFPFSCPVAFFLRSRGNFYPRSLISGDKFGGRMQFLFLSTSSPIFGGPSSTPYYYCTESHSALLFSDIYFCALGLARSFLFFSGPFLLPPSV